MAARNRRKQKVMVIAWPILVKLNLHRRRAGLFSGDGNRRLADMSRCPAKNAARGTVKLNIAVARCALAL